MYSSRRGAHRGDLALAAPETMPDVLIAPPLPRRLQDDSTKGGRRITSKGMKECDTVAASIKA